MKTALIALLLIAGCSRPMTMREKVLFGAMIAGQAADYETTRRGVSAGMRELNPILADRPDQGNILLFKAGVVGVLWGMGEIWPDSREWLYGIGTVSGGAAAWHNDRLYDRHR